MFVWQMHGVDEWRFGMSVRGVVRTPYYAEVYYDEERSPAWIWFTRSGPRGSENTFEAAIEAAERVLKTCDIIREE